MENPAEKVYVAIGDDLQEGLGTLQWALKKWASHSISIVILCLANNTPNYVYTPFGKLPASSVSDEKIEVLRKFEQDKVDKNLAHYISFCGKVKAEILHIRKFDEPIHKIILELISDLRVTKLVMGITFMKSSSWKSNSLISGLFYIQGNKPDFCELFIIGRGKLVFLRAENNEEFIEDDNGVLAAKSNKKVSLKGWIGRMFTENSNGKSPRLSPSSSTSNDSPNQWEKNVEEIEKYFLQLLSSNLEEEENEIIQSGPQERDLTLNMSGKEKIAALTSKICEAHKTVKLKKKEAKANAEKRAKAEWTISLCTRRSQELEARITKEIAARLSLAKDLDVTKEEIHEIRSEIQEKKSKLESMIELQRELSSKLKSSSLAKTHIEAQLEKAVGTRADMVQDIEKVRRQRDVVHRRIEFCREKDAIGLATRLSELSFRYKEFSDKEIRVATDDFSERLRLKSSGDWTNVYRGRINHTSVAIKLCGLEINGLSQEDFQAKVKLLSQIRHPHIVAVLGFCTELKCIVFEYMHNGSLRDTLFSTNRSSKRTNQRLNWHTRIRIAAEVGLGLGFLHLAQPRPITHGGLNPSKILLDHNNVAKIDGFRIGLCSSQSDTRADLRALGNVVLQLLTGRNWAGLVEETRVMDRGALIGVLDHTAGEWPLELGMELAMVAIRCLSTKEGVNEPSAASVMREIIEVRKKADELAARGGMVAAVGGGGDTEESSVVPSVFLCPIFQDVMKDPHVAEDGFSYELEAIKEWLGTGHDTSPMTNLKLKHKHLTANHTLRSLIEDWHNKRSIPLR